MVGWHHRLDGHEFEQALGVGDGQGGLACCSPWDLRELDHNKGEPCRIDAFELWCWRRLLRVPWTARRPIQAILKEINPEYSLEALMLKLTLQYFGHLMQREELDAGD